MNLFCFIKIKKQYNKTNISDTFQILYNVWFTLLPTTLYACVTNENKREK